MKYINAVHTEIESEKERIMCNSHILIHRQQQQQHHAGGMELRPIATIVWMYAAIDNLEVIMSAKFICKNKYSYCL